ncbi:MAG: Druantia anti-phage system protein DruA [Armatimonadota bacterium]
MRQKVVAAVEHAREVARKAQHGNLDKGRLRALHRPARLEELRNHQEWLQEALPRLLPYFASGQDVVPHTVEPQLVLVTEQWQRDLFRAARLSWSLPYTKGFGRRLQFLLFDAANGKLMGLIGLQSPPLSFPPRDSLFEYPQDRKTELVNQTMDMYTLGAVPPYSRLLGGKLAAMAAASDEVRAAYRHKYRGRRTEMEGRHLPARLVAITTTSAYGRSSIYNRLRFGDYVIAESIGYTEGYGTFHLSNLYPLLREFLEEQGISTRGGFGTGPRIKWQSIVRALERLGLTSDLLRHGALREAFLFPLVDNLDSYMSGRAQTPSYRRLPFADMAAFWKERWLLPRAGRVDGWHRWTRSELRRSLLMRDGGDS